MDALTQPVVYKSLHFCMTGWGARELSLGELACAFDLPSHCVALVTEPTLLKSLFPLKLQSEPLQFLLESLSSSVPAKPLVPSILASWLIPIAPLVPKATLALVAKHFASLDVFLLFLPMTFLFSLMASQILLALACPASRLGFGMASGVGKVFTRFLV
jgi:hypothetical protein